MEKGTKMARFLSLTVAFLFLFFLRKADALFYRKCRMKAWSEWNKCSKSCGWGTRSRGRQVMQGSPKYCRFETREQKKDCNKHPCPVDCAWANWGQWAKCSVTCASGKITRKRIVASREKHGAKKCLPSAASETKTCKLKPCPIHRFTSEPDNATKVTSTGIFATVSNNGRQTGINNSNLMASTISTTAIFFTSTTAAAFGISLTSVTETVSKRTTASDVCFYNVTSPDNSGLRLDTCYNCGVDCSKNDSSGNTTVPDIFCNLHKHRSALAWSVSSEGGKTKVIGDKKECDSCLYFENICCQHYLNAGQTGFVSTVTVSLAHAATSTSTSAAGLSLVSAATMNLASFAATYSVVSNFAPDSEMPNASRKTVVRSVPVQSTVTVNREDKSMVCVPGSHDPAGAISPTKAASPEIKYFTQNRLESTLVSQSVVEKEVSSLPDSSKKATESIPQFTETYGPTAEVPHVSTTKHPHTFLSTSPDLGTETTGRSNFILTTSQFTTATTTTVSTQKTTRSTIMPNFVSTTPIFPLSDVEVVIVTTIQSLGCTFILISLAVTLAVFLILRDFSYERFLHMNMEIALFLGHILVLTMRDITNVPTLCKIAGVGFQFFFLASFCFMLLEALQAYAIRTNVISYGGYCSRLQSFVIGWGMSGVITVVTAVIKHQEYVSYWSCWLNLGSSVVYASTGPVLILSAVTIIIAEASGMGNYTALLDRNQDQYTAANANAKALFIILPLSTASWFVGLYAVYHANIALYSVVHALNVALGISIFVFHSLGNPKAHAIFKKLISRCCLK